MKGASFARQGEASDLELVPTWVTVWVKNVAPHRKTTFCNKKSPKPEVFEDFCHSTSIWIFLLGNFSTFDSAKYLPQSAICI